RPAEGVPEAERDRAGLGRERRGQRGEVAAELGPGVGAGALGLRGVAVAARIERNHAEARAQALRDVRPERRAEAVRVVQERERPVATPVEERELDAAPGERD